MEGQAVTDLAAMIAFAEARLDEDEVAARAATSGTWHATERTDGMTVVTALEPMYWPVTERHSVPDGEHIARHDPARVLRDVEAKRARIERYKRAVEVGGANPSSFVRGQDDGYAEACLDSIRDDTATWSDHPEYREGWKR
jgi:hypothetical protein